MLFRTILKQLLLALLTTHLIACANSEKGGAPSDVDRLGEPIPEEAYLQGAGSTDGNVILSIPSHDTAFDPGNGGNNGGSNSGDNGSDLSGLATKYQDVTGEGSCLERPLHIFLATYDSKTDAVLLGKEAVCQKKKAEKHCEFTFDAAEKADTNRYFFVGAEIHADGKQTIRKAYCFAIPEAPDKLGKPIRECVFSPNTIFNELAIPTLNIYGFKRAPQEVAGITVYSGLTDSLDEGVVAPHRGDPHELQLLFKDAEMAYNTEAAAYTDYFLAFTPAKNGLTPRHGMLSGEKVEVDLKSELPIIHSLIKQEVVLKNSGLPLMRVAFALIFDLSQDLDDKNLVEVETFFNGLDERLNRTVNFDVQLEGILATSGANLGH